MKRILAILLTALLVFALCACSKKENNNSATTTLNNGSNNNSTENYTGSYEIEWGELADDKLIGAWKPVGEEAIPYTVLFTPEKTVRMVDGTSYVEADVEYGVDGAGNVSVCAFGTYLYGTWTFEINDDMLTINRPIVNEADEVEGYDTFTFESVNYDSYNLTASEDFKAVDELIGTWTNAGTLESYTFKDNGYALIKYDEIIDSSSGEKIESTIIEATYVATSDSVTITFISNGEEVSETLEYVIDGTEIVFDGEAKAYLNGDGDPNAAVAE